MKKLLCALAVLIAVPVAAQEREEENVRVIVRGGHGGHGGHESDVVRLPPLPPEPPMAAPAYGIPPHVVEKLGLPQPVVQKVQDLSFDANDKLIGLEADLKRAQLQLERELRQPNPTEATVMQLVEKVGGAETAVRKNRVGLMLAIKKAVGPEHWQKLEAELGPLGGMGPRRVRIERRMELPREHGAPPVAPLPPPAPERKR